ncbi:hypothetical protein BYT27DRAFT_7248005 [Phlegmacium glaucopus]|nr:hypothetical protein BYT27DRAFT_7248005 [Phlegmacium glaucopus]
MVGNDANLDVLQLVSCLARTTEVSNILGKYPQWDRSPCHLKLPALSHKSKEIPDSADHIKPGSWRGNVKLKDISILTSWNRGRRMMLISSLHLALFLVDAPLADDDVDKSIEVLPVGSAKGTANSDTHEMEICVNVEDKLGAELASSNTEAITTNQKAFNSKVLIKGSKKNKAHALKDFSKYHKYLSHLTDPHWLIC